MDPEPTEGRRTCRHLRLRGVGLQKGTEGGSVEGGGAEGGHAHRQVSGGDADGRTLELQLLDQLVHRLQSPEEQRRSRPAASAHRRRNRKGAGGTHVSEVGASAVSELLSTLDRMVTTVEAKAPLMFATPTSCLTFITTWETCGGGGGVSLVMAGKRVHVCCPTS